MSQDPTLTRQKLDTIWEGRGTSSMPLQGKKFAVLSDLHLGDGSGSDNFRYNENALKAALTEYRGNGYELILLGDIEEFWQFDLDKIKSRYENTVYSLMKAVGDDKIHRIFGNHDIEWSDQPDPTKRNPIPPQRSTESIILQDKTGIPRILLIHGHQGSLESDKTSWFSRFWVKVYAKTVESFVDWLGIRQEPAATKSAVPSDYEKIMYSWARDNKVILVCGHSHRAIFASSTYLDSLKSQLRDLQVWMYANRSDKSKKKQISETLRKMEKIQVDITDEENKKRNIDALDPDRKKPLPCYFNSGCGLYTDGLTAIEIDEDEIKLVKWSNRGSKDPEFDKYKGEIKTFLSAIDRA